MRAILLVSLATLSSCAWANPDNRPVWNGFERHVVPDDDGWFYATLPVTVPLGVGAVLVDTLVAHPLQVVDDAFDDAGELWKESSFDFDDHYYTEVLLVPLRAVGTPLVFAGSFLGRSMFDVPPRVTESERQARDARRLERQAARFVAWLQRLPRGNAGYPPSPPEQWHERFAAPLRAALRGDARTRRLLHEGMLRAGLVRYGDYDAVVGLRDADPVVRFATLAAFPEDELTEALLAELQGDPVESIRLLLQERR